VALESLGRLDEAEREYQLAQERARGNGQIESNYKQFKKSHGKAADEKK
jgi:Tfp pilus assembly protein PilF